MAKKAAYEGPSETCSFEGCDNSFKGHSWAAIRAHDGGWFRQKNGDNWCPEHIPAWVDGWRKKRRAQKERETARRAGNL